MEADFVIVDGVVVPESALRRAERRNLYGSVPGLDDEELAEPEELERQVFWQEWGPVLALPAQGKQTASRPEFFDDGGVEFNAFATVDFQRTMPEFDKARYKAEKLREKLQEVLIMFGIVKERLPKVAAMVLKYLRMGVIGEEHVVSEDVLALARLERRVDKLRAEIRALEKVSWGRRQREFAEVLR
jgi:hypothetical protein